MSLNIDANGRPSQPSLTPYPQFNAQTDVEMLKQAMEGAGTDEEMIIEILGNRNYRQRIEIAESYKASYGQDLREKLSGELSGDFGELVDMMFFTPIQLKATILYNAIYGAGTDERALVEVICTSTNAEIQDLKDEYADVCAKNGKPGDENKLEDDIKNDCSGYFERILVALLAARRPELSDDDIQKIANKGVDAVIDKKQALADAQALYDAGEKKLGTDEEKFIQILCNRNRWQLYAISVNYEKISEKRLTEAIESETSGDFRTALITTLTAQISPPKAFAHLIHEAISGAGTNDDSLQRLILWRSEIDMMDIKNCYLSLYNESLGDAIRGDTSGDYEKLLLALVKEN